MLDLAQQTCMNKGATTQHHPCRKAQEHQVKQVTNYTRLQGLSLLIQSAVGSRTGPKIVQSAWAA